MTNKNTIPKLVDFEIEKGELVIRLRTSHYRLGYGLSAQTWTPIEIAEENCESERVFNGIVFTESTNNRIKKAIEDAITLAYQEGIKAGKKELQKEFIHLLFGGEEED